MSPKAIVIACMAAACVSAIGAGAWWLHRTGFQAGAESVRAELREASDDASSAAREETTLNAAKAARIDTDVLAAKRATAPVLASARADGNGLRFALAHRGQPAAGADAGQCAAERADARVLADLLDEGSRLAEEGAGIVGAAVPLIDGLQARLAAP